MKRPQQKTLWRLSYALTLLALLDIACTCIGLFFFHGKEGNPLIVALADFLPGSSSNIRVATAVWLSKLSVIALILLAAHWVVRSKPLRDDWVLFIGLLLGIIVYVPVVCSWVWYFFLVSSLS